MEEPGKILNGGNSLRPQKRIFLGLLAVTCLLFTILLGVLWYVPYVGLSNLNPHLPLILGVLFAALLFLLVGGLLLLALTVVLGRDLFFSKKLRGAVIKLLLPLMSGVGKLCGVSKDQVSALLHRNQQPTGAGPALPRHPGQDALAHAPLPAVS